MKVEDLNIIQARLPHSEYFRQKFSKRQIIIHHTASGEGVDGDINWWKTDPKHIATAFVISRHGVIYQCFSSSCWAYHTGLGDRIDKQNIGIELDSWGPVLKSQSKNKYYPVKWYSRTFISNLRARSIDIKDIVFYQKHFKGFETYERYTDKQIESLRKLLIYLTDRYMITREHFADLEKVSYDARKGDAGIWFHNSLRHDKFDMHPQKELMEMLSKLK